MFCLSYIYTNITLGIFTTIASSKRIRTYWQICPLLDLSLDLVGYLPDPLRLRIHPIHPSFIFIRSIPRSSSSGSCSETGPSQWEPTNREKKTGPDGSGRNPAGSGVNQKQGHNSKDVHVRLLRLYL